MKLITLNTHSLAEKDYSRKLDLFVQAIAEEFPDIIALQEVNQTACEEMVQACGTLYVPCCENAVIRKDNHVYRAAEKLRQLGKDYFWTWLPVKKGYGRYDEGIAVLSRSRIIETDTAVVSGINDPDNWKTRKIVGIRTEKEPDAWFYSVHYGWWNDADEPFEMQWKRTSDHLKERRIVWLMGDFNSPAEVRGESYDMIKTDGWYDSYTTAREKDGGITAISDIDGWKGGNVREMRIDQIWCSKSAEVISSRVIFNGRNKSVVSDHYGVEVEYKGGAL